MIASYLYHVVFVKLQSISYYFNNILSSNFKLDSFQIFQVNSMPLSSMSCQIHSSLLNSSSNLLVSILFCLMSPIFKSSQLLISSSRLRSTPLICIPVQIESPNFESYSIHRPHTSCTVISIPFLISSFHLLSSQFLFKSSPLVSNPIQFFVISFRVISFSIKSYSNHVSSLRILFNSLSTHFVYNHISTIPCHINSHTIASVPIQFLIILLTFQFIQYRIFALLCQSVSLYIYIHFYISLSVSVHLESYPYRY